ncbi:MAG: UDP-N-acetylglucosamine--N-acetylmuramyl-(pentapeptide) pyrophosphoryl-undecaprenol N-acetylglucosamine transferase [Candidatus Omnitrophica bacterium]|nr:UDP-N-acetylglucosamine--N-acetylmuramyl-(pentapeptide) pyrophosphoryl-undecaprenol N-acetylglucosamine transferase [Candidatus Omnitrophota bacterium]
MNIVLACERSKGHLYPALILAEYIKKNALPYNLFFYGLKKKDKLFLESKGYKCWGLDLGFRNLLVESFLRLIEALVIIFILRPKKVLGFGGRNSLFLVFTSSFFIPTFLFEPNICFGRANQVLSFFVQRVFLGMREAKKNKELKVGVPLRRGMLKKLDKREVREKLGFNPDLKVFLVFGGSLGSSSINTLFMKAALLLKNSNYRFGVIHLTGDRDFKMVQSFYKDNSILGKAFPFYEDMEFLYTASDLVVCRSGASTISELSFFGLPCLLIPHPLAYSHQKKNAQFLFRKGSALVREEKELSPDNLFFILRDFLEAPEKFSYLGKNIYSLKIWEEPDIFSQKILQYF